MPKIRITAQMDGVARCGVVHPRGPVDHPASRFTPHQVEQLRADRRLAVEIVDDDAPLPAAQEKSTKARGKGKG